MLRVVTKLQQNFHIQGRLPCHFHKGVLSIFQTSFGLCGQCGL